MKIVFIAFSIAIIFFDVGVSGKYIKNSETSIYKILFERLHQEIDNSDILTKADENPVETRWIDQKLDNFDENNSKTWQRRYMINNNYYLPGGPLIIYIGGESSIRASSISGTRHIVTLAKENNGSLLFPEHRYYGESIPTPDLSTENLKYLNVRQALADLAEFIPSMKTSIPGAQNSKVILVGGSYPATMATWFKKLYPDMVVGSWASSGPLFAKTDFYEYKEVVGQAIKDIGGEKCYNRIANGFKQLQNFTLKTQVAEVKALFKICDNFNHNNQLDIWSFFSYVAEMFSYLVQYAESGDIEKACLSFVNDDEDYINLAKYFLSYLDSNTCNDMTYDAMIESLKYTTAEGGASRQWTYQTCNEFGWFQSSTSNNQPFGTLFPVEYSLQICKDLFGEQFSPKFIEQQVTATNEFFGGYSPSVENIYFTQGAIDPWSAMGMKENIIPLASHCSDLRAPKSDDSTILLRTRTRVSELVKKWLSD